MLLSVNKPVTTVKNSSQLLHKVPDYPRDEQVSCVFANSLTFIKLRAFLYRKVYRAFKMVTERLQLSNMTDSNG